MVKSNEGGPGDKASIGGRNRISDNVCGQDPCQLALLTGHGNFPALLLRIVEGREQLGNQ